MKRIERNGPKTGLRRIHWGRLVACGGLLAVVALFTGCRGGRSDLKNNLGNPERSHILQMLAVYRAYLVAHNQAPPASPEALKGWAEKEGKEKLKIHDSVEDVLKSPRDGQPYAWAPPPKGRRMGPQTFVVYEKEGKGGKHYFAGEMGVVGEMSDKEIADALGK